MEEPSSDADEAVKSIENDKVSSILNQVSQLSELDKYMLYLQLPTEETADDGIDDASKVPQTLMAKRIDAAVKWIRQNYTDTHDQSVFLPKEEFYEHYREECEVDDSKPLSIADFGKVIKLVFPKIAQRRLGQRGKSRYGYEGLKKKEGNTSSTCTACNRDLTEKPSPDVHLYTLSCQIVCEWASQLLDRQLSDIKSLSEYLVSKGFSYGKSAAKFSLLSGSSGHHKQLEKDRKSPRFQDGQVLLQRKLLQKEIIRQHKQKLQEQQKFQRELAKTSPLNLTHHGLGGRKPRNQPRPSSVQSYTPSWSSNQINSSYGFLASGQTLPLSGAHSNAAQSSSRLMGILVSGGKDSLTPMKRCQSASVVEKYSDSSNVLDLFQERDAIITKQKLLSTQNPAFSSPSITSDSTDTIMSSPAITRGNSRAGSSRLENLLAQHYKRNGDSLSPDGESKRRCMTSLGVREQENLNPIHLSDESELTRLRPYSCPVICSDLGKTKSAVQEEVKKCKTSDDWIKSEMWPVKLRCDKSDTKRETPENNKIHFVQKPTVINGRINNLHNVVSCPDFQQLTKDVEMPPGDVRHSRPSSNILNSLLSSDLDLLWRKSDDLRADKLAASRPHSLASSLSDLSTLTNHQLRVITDPSHSSESAVKLSNQSSRSAFVPVTSHKQLHISSSMQQETKLPQHFPPVTLSKDPEASVFQSSEQSCKSRTDSLTTSYVDKIFLDHLDHQFYSNSSNFPHTVSPSVNASPQETSGQASLFNQDSSSLPLVSDTEPQQKQEIPDTVLYMSHASCQPHLVVASAIPTTYYSTSTVTRISTSTVASPVVSSSSPVSSTHTAFVMTPPPNNLGSVTCPNTSSVTNNTISTCVVSSTSCSSSTPQTSTSNSSTITPPRRVSKNRFTPIRPKLGGSRSPQFTTTPSPTKKDMRPVSAILKEQRGIKIPNGLLVNLGNNYQGEVKFQMPAEILCLAPGKSKTSDLLVTINPSNSISSSKSYSLTSNSSPLLWPLTIPPQQAKSSDSLTSPGLNQSAYSIQPNVEALSVQLATELNPSTPDLPITLCSPNITLHRNIGTTASSCVNKQLIILSPTKSVKSGDRSVDSIHHDHHQLYHQTMSTNCQIDQRVDSVTMHGLDIANEKKSIESPHINEPSCPLAFNANVVKIEEALNNSTTGQAEFKGDKDGRPYVQFGNEIHDNLMLNQKTMLHHKLYDQAMSTNGQCSDQKVDFITLHGFDTANEKRPLGNLCPTGQSFSVSCNANSATTEDLTSSASSQAEFKVDKEVRPPAQLFSEENFDKLMQSQKTMSLSSTLLSELSQLINAGHQPSIQHSSSPSAFYKCSNQQLKPSDNLVKNLLNQAILTSKVDTNIMSLPQQTVESSNAQASQIARKRKVGGEEHGNNKKINRSMKKELDDVFIINIEDSVKLPNGTGNASRDGMQSEKLDDKSSVDDRTSDTDKLLGMLPNREGLTVKETVKALNDLRAKMVSGTQNMGRATNSKADLGTCKTSIALSTLGDLQPCSSEASLFNSDKVSLGSDMGQPHGRERKNASLNVESLESDALLDLDQAWSLNLVSEMTDGIKEQKTSVGVAAKSASKTVKHIVSRQVPDPKSHSNAITINSIGKTQPCSVLPKTENTSPLSSKPKVAARKKTSINFDKGHTQLNQIDSLNKQSTTQEHVRRSSMTNIELKSSNVQHAGASIGKASNHPTLAQYLAVSTVDKGVAPVRSLSLTSEMESDHELPGEILDFITESCYRRQNSFHSDLYNTDKLEQSSTLLRSFSAPNTLALVNQASHSARVNDIKVSLADHESNLYDLDCDTSGVNPHRSSQSQSSGIFLSPVGTAKMNRRLSMERSVASESNLSKSTGDSKANAERPPSRLKGSVEKCKMPVDRLISKLLTDKTSRPVWGRGSGGNGKEEAYADIQQGHVSNVKGDPVEKDFIKLLDQRLFGGFSCSTNTEASKPDTDRSTNHTPLSDGGYGSITQTPVSDAVSISPSPVMMTSANYFVEAERRDILSPATIFMPLRSENNSRNAANNCLTGRANRTASDMSNYSKFVHFLDPSKLTSKNLVQTVLDSASANKSGRGVNSTSLQDLTTQIHCIPTPPSSPSNSHNNEASLNSGSENKNAHFGQAYSSVAKDNQCANVDTNTNHQNKFTSIPKVSSPKIAPVTSPLPQGHSRTQMYNPHPSPPFTPSSQLCLASPRCPTPCQLTSSGRTTPISDSNGAPNRFVPIQTSGILGNSAVGYIQPIRPVVTNVANMHTKSLLSSQMKAKPQEMPNFLNPEPEQHTTGNTKTSQRKDHNSERHVTVPPALVLSLTGGIGSVSGRGMKDGWGGHEMSQAATGYPSQVVVKQELDQTDTMSTSMHLSNDMLPTYEEAISLLVGSQNNFNSASEASKKAGSVSESNSSDQLSEHSLPVSTQQTDGAKSQSQSTQGISQVPQQSGQKKRGDNTKTLMMETFLNMVSKNEKMQLSHSHQPPVSHSVVTSKKQTSDSSLRQLLSSKTSSLSTMLQAPAFSTVHPKPVPLEAPSKVQISSETSKSPKETNRRKSSSSLNELFTTKWNSAEMGDSFQISELPSACYSGTTPNKTAPDVSGYGSLPTFLDQQPHHQHLMSMNFSSEMEHLRQDDLDETLDVLKNIDSQYFQADEDEMV